MLVFTQTTTSTVKFFIKKKFVTASGQSGLNNHATQNRKILLQRPRISTLKNNGGHFFSFTEDKIFDVPSNVFSSLSHRLSIFAVLNQTEKSFGYFTIMLKGEGLF